MAEYKSKFTEEELVNDHGHLLNHLWERYWVTNDPQDLRTYLEAGGDSAGVESLLIEAIKSGRIKKKKSGRNPPDPFRDIQAYLLVEKYRDSVKEKTRKRPSKESAIADVARKIAEKIAKKPRKKIEPKEATLRNQYDRGLKLLFMDGRMFKKTVFGKYFLPDLPVN